MALLLWVTMYPEPSDPKNIHYVMWKHGLNHNMDLDAATAGMTHDTFSVSIVKGMTREQLKDRFGYIRSIGEAGPYLRLCYTQNSSGQLGVKAHGKEVVFLRDDPWMVILDNGRAVDLVLCKGY